jgi:putative ABC transport system ATP-binding protein
MHGQDAGTTSAASVNAGWRVGSPQPLLRLQDVSRVFRMGDVDVVALRDVTLSIERGDFVVVLGPSGSGKTTLLNVLGGIDRPTTGRVWYAQRELTALDDRGLTAYRRREVGFVFQFYNLVPTLTALENVQIGTELVDDALDPFEALRLVDLADRAEHFPSQLSGGQQQRVAIARALAKRPRLLLTDEPTGALDLDAARQVLAILQRLNREGQLTVLLITHNAAIASIAQRTMRIVSGRIAEARRNERVLPAEQVSW